MKPSKPIPRISKKKLAANGGKVPFSSITKPSKRIKKRPRSKKEFARIYGSKERVEFVKSLPCSACGIVGYSENAHIETGGMGRKSDYTKIIPLCGPHPLKWAHSPGCHHLCHTWGREGFERIRHIDLGRLADYTEKRWLQFSASQTTEAR